MKQKSLILILGGSALACIVAVVPAIRIRIECARHVRQLESADPAAFEEAFAALAYDLDDDVVPLLCDEAEEAYRGSRFALYYQILRILHERCGCRLTLEDVKLPPPEHVRRIVEERRRGRR